MHGLNTCSRARSEKTLNAFVSEVANHGEIVACGAMRRKMGMLAMGYSSNAASHQSLRIASLSN